MPPNQPINGSPYEFLNAPKQKRKLLLVNGSFKQRLLVVVGGGIILIIAVYVLGSLLKGGTSGTDYLISMAQQQNELVTIATAAESNTSTQQQTTKNLAINVELGLNSEQNQLIAYLKTIGVSVSSKVLNDTNSTALNNTLTTAQSSGNYDAVFIQVVTNELNTYVQTIKTAFSKTHNATGQNLLSKDYQAANLLLQQASSASSAAGTS